MFLSVLFTVFISPSQALQPVLSCYTFAPESIKVEWTAYKFTDKTAVKGRLKTATAKISGTPQTLDEALPKTSFEVDALSVETDNPARDITLRDNFFKLMKDTKISGRILSVKNDVAKVELKMNGVVKTVDFKVQKTDPVVSATGTIDILDFAMKPSFQKIQEACKVLHTGTDGKSKTWSTVDLNISAQPINNCKKG